MLAYTFDHLFDFFKLPLWFILIIFLDPEISVISLLLCEHVSSTSALTRIVSHVFHCFHKKKHLISEHLAQTLIFSLSV